MSNMVGHTMFNEIARCWPPVPSETQPETGTMMHMDQRSEQRWTESLASLHANSWWTGLRLITYGNKPDTYFCVRLIELNQKWWQKSGEFKPFLWPIPATMARELNLHIEITLISAEPLFFLNRTVFFHDLEEYALNSYSFVDEEGRQQHTWTSTSSSSLRERPEPLIVPPMTSILK